MLRHLSPSSGEPIQPAQDAQEKYNQIKQLLEGAQLNSEKTKIEIPIDIFMG